MAFTCGWLGVLVDKVVEQQPEGESLGMLIWLVLPLFGCGFIIAAKPDKLNKIIKMDIMYKNVGFEIIKEKGEEYLMILNLNG